MDVAKEVNKVIEGEVYDDPEMLERFSRDASLFRVRPQVVAAPKDAQDIKNLVRFINENKGQNLSLTARSGGTDMTGGPLNTSIILDMPKHMNRVIAVGKGWAVTQPGAFYRDFEKETLARNLLLPSYPASREICTVGGMVANNSGGEKTLTYGQTKEYVTQLKVVLADGNEYLVKPLNIQELEVKVHQPTFEGKLYREIFRLTDTNLKLLQDAKPDVHKNSSGYFLWDVWDGHTFDLTRLLTGSQGTLGIITEITFRLITPKKHSKLLVIFMSNLKPLAQVINSVLHHKPESFESYDDKTLKLALRFLPQMVRRLGVKNIFRLAWQFLPELKMTLTGGLPKLVLLAEFTGYSEKEVDAKMKAASHDLARYKLPLRLTRSELEAKKYWTVRRESFNLLRQKIKNKRTAPFIDDIVVRPEYLPDFLPELEKLLEPYSANLTYTISGHAGDGNFHIIPLVNAGDPKIKDIVPELSRKVYNLVLKYHGSITGEHNDGLIRSPFLKKMYGQEVYALFEETKRIFDPDGIFNPGKKVDSDFEFAMAHLDIGK